MAIQAKTDNHTAKVLGQKTSKIYMVIKITFLCVHPLAFLRVFLNASRRPEFTHVIFFIEKTDINKNIKGQSFFWILTEAIIVYYQDV